MAEEADWIGNLINWFIFYVFAGIFAYIGFLFVLIGQPTWWYDTVTGMDLLPPAVTAYKLTFDSWASLLSLTLLHNAFFINQHQIGTLYNSRFPMISVLGEEWSHMEEFG